MTKDNLKYIADKWFETTNMNEIDLVEMCFGGTTNEVYKIWVKQFGKPRFTIDWVTADARKIDMSPLKENLLKLEELVKVYEAQEKKQQKSKPDNSEGYLDKYKTQRNRIEELKRKYDRLRKELETNQKELSNNKENRKEDAIKGKINTNKKQIGDIFDKTNEVKREWENIDHRCPSLWRRLEFDNHKITGWEKLLENLNKQIQMIESQQTSSPKVAEEENKKKQIREIIRHSKFSIIKVEGTKK